MENLKKLHIKNIISNSAEEIVKEEILHILTTIEKLTIKNRILLERIRSDQPRFNYDLYRPKKNHGFDWNIEKQMKLRQIDKLLEEQEYLSKKMQEVRIKKYFSHLDQESSHRRNQNEFKYEDIKNILSPVGNQSLSCSERIDQLNIALRKMKNKIEIESNIQKMNFRKDKCEEFINPLIPSKKYWKLKNQVSQLKCKLKNLTKENKCLLKLIVQKDAQIQKSCLSQRILQQQLQNCLRKLSEIHQNLRFFQCSIEKHNQSPSKIISNPEFEFYNAEQGLQVNIFRIENNFKGQATMRNFSQINDFLLQVQENFKNQSPQIPKIVHSPVIEISSPDSQQNKMGYIFQRPQNRQKLDDHHKQPGRSSKQISTLRNCQSHPNITHLNINQILNIENLNEKQNIVSNKQQKGAIRFKRTPKHQKESPYLFAESFL